MIDNAMQARSSSPALSRRERGSRSWDRDEGVTERDWEGVVEVMEAVAGRD